jgi:hypothetical protein
LFAVSFGSDCQVNWSKRCWFSPYARKPIELPPVVARALIRDMNAYFAETNLIKRDKIAIRQLVVLNEYLGRRERPLRVTDVKEMFLQMRDHV